VIGIIFCFVRFEWYPSFYYAVLQASNIFLIVACAMLLTGPLLVLVAYKADFARDFVVILVLQCTVMFFGVKLLYVERPVFLVFSVDRFVVVTANSINQSTISPLVFLDSITNSKPLSVAAHLPESADLSSMLNVLKGGADIEFQPSLYEPIENQALKIKDKARDYTQVLAAAYPGITNESSTVFYPLVNPKGDDKLIAFDLKKMNVVVLYDLDPWVKK